jgi:hypothetical protein
MNNHRSFKVSKKIGENIFSLEGFDYFAKVIQGHLMREEAVVDILSLMLKKAETGEIRPNTRMDLQIFLEFLG